MTDFKAKCNKLDFDWGSAPDPAGGAYSAPPDPLAGFGGHLRGRGRGWAGIEEGKGEGNGREGEVEGGKGRAPKLLLNQGPSVLLRHCQCHEEKINKQIKLFIRECHLTLSRLISLIQM